MQEVNLRLGGVPEHFNYPWVQWVAANAVQSRPIRASWKDFPGGSGAMIGALEVGELDVALVLTEAVAHALNRRAAVVPLSLFVQSPLVWGIFSGAQNAIDEVVPHSGVRYAISRFGSGSHLMAMVDAEMRGGQIAENQWVVVQSLAKGKEVLKAGEADLFFWEKWMTKPLVDQGILKMIGERPTPWPSFTMVCTQSFAEKEANLNAIRLIFDEVVAIAQNFHNQQDNCKILAEAYGLKEQDAAAWLAHVRWANQWTDPLPAIEQAKVWLEKIKRD